MILEEFFFWKCFKRILQKENNPSMMILYQTYITFKIVGTELSSHFFFSCKKKHQRLFFQKLLQVLSCLVIFYFKFYLFLSILPCFFTKIWRVLCYHVTILSRLPHMQLRSILRMWHIGILIYHGSKLQNHRHSQNLFQSYSKFFFECGTWKRFEFIIYGDNFYFILVFFLSN